MIQGVNHVAISVPDLGKAIQFYCDLLGFRKVEQASWTSTSAMSEAAEQLMGIPGTAADAAHLRGSNMLIELFQFRDCNARPQDPDRPVVDHGITHICLAVQDLDREFERLRAAGMRFDGVPTKVAPGVRSVYGRDPFGNVIELEEAAGRSLAGQSAISFVKHKISSRALGVLFLVLFAAFALWQTPYLWSRPLSPADIDRYAAELEQHLDQPPADKAAFIERVRQWAAGDDGRPVLMVNLMRYRDQLGELPPNIDFKGTPQQANAYYESLVAPLALKRGEYPLIGGDAQTRSLTASDADSANQWTRVVVMRAPSRRAFIEFMADPSYGPTVPYKHAATDVVLIPIDAGMVVPDLRWLVGGLLLVVYLLVLWRRAASALRTAPQRP